MLVGSCRRGQKKKRSLADILSLLGAGCVAVAIAAPEARAWATVPTEARGEHGFATAAGYPSASFDGIAADGSSGVFVGEPSVPQPAPQSMHDPIDDPIQAATPESGSYSWPWNAASACQPECAPAATPGLLERLHCLHAQSDKCWSVRMEALILWRNAPQNRPLFTTLNYGQQVLGPVALNANQFQSDPLAAPRITLTNIDSCGVGVEASYLYAGNFYSQRSLPYVPNGYAFAAPGIYHNLWGLDPAPPISSAQSTLLANLQSAEFNGRLPIGWGATSFLAGVRWLQWWETWTMTDSFIDPSNPSITGVDTWRTGSTNNLYGFQIGLDSILLGHRGAARIDGLAKAGAYYNDVIQNSSYNYVTTAPYTFAKAAPQVRTGTAAFAGEIGLTAVMPIACNWDFRCGYFGLFLTNIAQPTDQLSGQVINQNPTPAVGSISAGSTVIVQGVSLGLEGRW